MQTTNETPPLHVIFGAGQVGAQLARLLHARGLRVRVVRRSAAAVGDGIEVWSGDARDRDFAVRATAGAGVVYHCMNPSAYTARAWREELPALAEAVIAGAKAAGARLVWLDNLYGYGVSDRRLTEETPMRPHGPKGEVRAQIAARVAEAGRDAGLRWVAGRAGDYFGPGTDQTHITDETVRGLLIGRRPWLVGDPQATHAFSYVRDVVRALAALGAAGAEVEGRVFHLPIIEIAPVDLYAHLASALGVTTRPRRAHPLLVRALSPFVSLFRELRETMYQWDRPFLADDSRFRTRFPGLATSLAQAVRETAEAARPEPAGALAAAA